MNTAEVSSTRPTGGRFRGQHSHEERARARAKGLNRERGKGEKPGVRNRAVSERPTERETRGCEKRIVDDGSARVAELPSPEEAYQTGGNY